MRINNNGTYGYCRWATDAKLDNDNHIARMSPQQYFQQEMSPVRQQLLEGQAPVSCGSCYRMEEHGKVSGRQRQLLKIGVRSEQFVKTMQSSAWLDEFRADGTTDQMPQDWQIDLGNYCNSACVFCLPGSSSRLANEFKKIGLIDQLPSANWSDDPRLVKKLLDTLSASPHIRYLHFIGGETLITPAFGQILQELIDRGLNRSATIGFTTNLTVWDQKIVDLLRQFHCINLGVSVECLHPVNDYARWPSEISKVQHILDQWLDLARSQKWYMQMRITPTVLTIGHLITIYQYALINGISVESCNFLEHPVYLRPSVLPMIYRRKIIDQIGQWVSRHAERLGSETVINTRHPDFASAQVIQDAMSYVNYLTNQPDESYRLPELARYLRLIDQSRNICVMDYLPEYEELFRSAGY